MYGILGVAVCITGAKVQKTGRINDHRGAGGSVRVSRGKKYEYIKACSSGVMTCFGCGKEVDQMKLFNHNAWCGWDGSIRLVQKRKEHGRYNARGW